MSNWIRVENGENKPLKEEQPYGSSGVTLRVFVAPQDVPNAVRGDYDAKRERFVIQFRYMSSEPVVREDNGPITLHVGKNSNRLYEIEVDVDSLEVNSVGLEVAVAERINKVLQDGKSERRTPRGRSNLGIARRVLDQKRSDVFASLASPR